MLKLPVISFPDSLPNTTLLSPATQLPALTPADKLSCPAIHRPALKPNAMLCSAPSTVPPSAVLSTPPFAL